MSTWPDVEIPECSIGEYVLTKAEAFGNEISIADHHTGQCFSFNEVVVYAKFLAGALQTRGIGKGDVIGIFAPNDPWTAVAFLGASLTGATVSMINSTFSAEELLRPLELSSIKYIITTSTLLTTVSETLWSFTEIFTFDEATGATSFTTLILEATLVVTVEVTVTEIAVLFYSSGTTGTPKGICLSHYSLVSRLAQIQAEGCFTFGAGDIFLGLQSFSFQYGVVYILLYGLCVGSKVVTLQEYEPTLLLEAIQTNRPTFISLVPYEMAFIATDPRVDEYDLSSVQELMSGGAPASEEVASMCAQRLDCTVRQNYGATEIGMVLLVPYGYVKYTVAGRPLPHVEAIIADLTTKEQLTGADQHGELWIRSPTTMIGYLNNETATASVLDTEGWYHTEDYCYIDGDGDFVVVDRIKDLILVEGQYVAPSRVEEVLMQHGSVADCGVIGAAINGVDLPVAFVVVEAGVEATEELAQEIILYVTTILESYMWIYEVIFIDEIPRNASGKVVRADLRTLYATTYLAGTNLANLRPSVTRRYATKMPQRTRAKRRICSMKK